MVKPQRYSHEVGGLAEWCWYRTRAEQTALIHALCQCVFPFVRLASFIQRHVDNHRKKTLVRTRQRVMIILREKITAYTRSSKAEVFADAYTSKDFRCIYRVAHRLANFLQSLTVNIVKISRYLAKIWTKYNTLWFFAMPVYLLAKMVREVGFTKNKGAKTTENQRCVKERKQGF